MRRVRRILVEWEPRTVAERRFLAEVEHLNIVGVYNFVQQADAATGEQAGYIVMEYVGGQSLRQLLGCENNERSLRFGLERTYRTRAQLASDRRRRTELVDLANSVRPSTSS